MALQGSIPEVLGEELVGRRRSVATSGGTIGHTVSSYEVVSAAGQSQQHNGNIYHITDQTHYHFSIFSNIIPSPNQPSPQATRGLMSAAIPLSMGPERLGNVLSRSPRLPVSMTSWRITKFARDRSGRAARSPEVAAMLRAANILILFLVETTTVVILLATRLITACQALAQRRIEPRQGIPKEIMEDFLLFAMHMILTLSTCKLPATVSLWYIYIERGICYSHTVDGTNVHDMALGFSCTLTHNILDTPAFWHPENILRFSVKFKKNERPRINCTSGSDQCCIIGTSTCCSSCQYAYRCQVEKLRASFVAGRSRQRYRQSSLFDEVGLPKRWFERCFASLQYATNNFGLREMEFAANPSKNGLGGGVEGDTQFFFLSQLTHITTIGAVWVRPETAKT